MGRQAIERPRAGAVLSETAAAFVASRLLVWVVAVVAAGVGSPDSGGAAAAFDRPQLTHPFGSALNALFSPLARWDSVWFLGIAHSGYHGASTAFFPLYPLLLRALRSEERRVGKE